MLYLVCIGGKNRGSESRQRRTSIVYERCYRERHETEKRAVEIVEEDVVYSEDEQAKTSRTVRILAETPPHGQEEQAPS
jgi:hypothetical protein